MRKLMFLLAILSLGTLCWAGSERQEAVSRLNHAAKVMHEIMDAPDQRIPDWIMKRAKCVAGNFFERSTICRHEIDAPWLAGLVGSECNLLPIGRPLRVEPSHWERSELKSLGTVHFAAPQRAIRETYISDPLSILGEI